MPREGTKAAKIMALYKKGLSTTEIAAKVGCRPEYVRVVARQRKGTGKSQIDRKYASTEKGRAAYQRMRDRTRRAYHAVAPEQRRKIYTRVYRAARRVGKPVRDARNNASNAVLRAGRQVIREATHA